MVFLLMHILQIVGVLSTLITFANLTLSLCFFLANFTKLSRYSNSLGMERIVSIGNNENLPLMKWNFWPGWAFYKISTCLGFVALPSTASISGCCISTGSFLLGIWALEKISCLVPQSLFNCSSAAISSSTSTFRLLFATECGLVSLPLF